MTKDKNGFVFIETIIAIVVLTSSLLLIYKSFNNILQAEKTRISYDDISYIYRSEYLKERLNDLNLNAALKGLLNDNQKYFITIGMEYEGLFSGKEAEKDFMAKLLADFEVEQMIIIKENKIDDLKKCNLECALDSSCANYSNCNNITSNISEEFLNYLKTIYIDIPCTYVLAVEYQTCGSDNTNCRNYYSWVSV